MTPEEKTIQQLNGIDYDDTELAHSDADDFLLKFLDETHPRVSEAYRGVVKRQGQWWFA